METSKTSFRLTRGGWAFLALCVLLAGGAFNAGVNMTYLLASLLIAVFVLSVVAPLWSIHGMICRRVIPETPNAGEPFDVHLVVDSRRRTTTRLLIVSDPLSVDRSSRRGQKVIMRVRPGERLNLTSPARPQPRGARPMPPIRWSSRFPFGIAECGVERGTAGELVVYPARGTLSAVASAALKPAGVRAGVPSRAGLPVEDFRSLREYRSGDNPRWIHWRASAHLGKLYVREMERERSAPVMVLLDSRLPAWLAASERPAAETALETAISFAAEVCRVSLKEGGAVTLVGFFPEAAAVRAAGTGSAEIRAVLEALARLAPSGAPTPDALMETAAQNGLATAWRVIAVTPTRETERSLSPALTGHPAQLYVAASPAFESVFQLGSEFREARA